MDIFVSSEMDSQEDKERRKAAIQEIGELGHNPIYFERLPGRPLKSRQYPIDKCRELVQKADILVAIVDDTVSEGMQAELDEATEFLGEDKMFYYFTDTGERDMKARSLWKSAKRGYILKEFENVHQLRKEMKRSIASYLEDALGVAPKRTSEILTDKVMKLTSGEESEEEFELKRGDIITVTCTADENFYADFLPRDKYVQRRTGGAFGAFGFPFGSDCPQFTKRVQIPEDDDYYLVIRVGVFSGTARIRVKVRCDYSQ